MGIKIVNQTNEQECGVCTLVSLHNHFYSEQIDKETALDQSNIFDGGMSIFDLEALANKLGLECESYEVKYSEFINLKINNYFILLLATGVNNNHYVIARKKKKYIEIYDSCSSEVKKIKYSELKKVFLNVVILVKKQPNKLYNKVFGKTSTMLMFDLKFVLLNILLSVAILATSIVSATFLNYVIDLAIDKSSINNLITICFIFILFYFMNDIFTYVSDMYMSKHIKSYFILFNNKILGSLANKDINFLSKVDKTWIYKIDECVYSISNFSIVGINKFITNIILCFVCVCIVGSIQYWLLVFALAYSLIELIFFLFEYRKKKEVFIEILRSENCNTPLYKNLIYSLEQEVWPAKRNNIIESIKKNYSNIYKNYSDVVMFRSNSTLLKSILKSFIEIVLIGFMSYLIIKTNELSIGKLTFVISAFSLLKNSISGLFSYPLSKIEFDVYWQVYKDLTTVGNLNITKEFKLDEEIKSITFKLQNKQITVDTKERTNVIDCSVVDLLKLNMGLYINNDEQKNKIDPQAFILLNDTSDIDLSMIVKHIEESPTEYSQYIKYFNLNLNKTTQTIYHKLIINLLCLLSCKDKIIFLDNIQWLIKQKDQMIVKQIIGKIKKHNTVFVTQMEEHD